MRRRRPMPCLERGCPVLTLEARCAEHRRPSLYGYEWQQRSKRYLALHRWCVVCGERATRVDHIVPHRGDLELFWDEDNWQSMCERDHNRKSASVDA